MNDFLELEKHIIFQYMPSHVLNSMATITNSACACIRQEIFKNIKLAVVNPRCSVYSLKKSEEQC